MPNQGTRICAMSSWPVSNACHKGQLPSLSATSMLAPRLHRVSTITGRWRAMALCKGRNLSGDLQRGVSVMKYTLEKSLLLRHPFQPDTVHERLIKSRMDKDLPDGAYVMVQQLPNLCQVLPFFTHFSFLVSAVGLWHNHKFYRLPNGANKT